MAGKDKSKDEKIREAEEIATKAMKRFKAKRKNQQVTSEDVPGDGLAKDAGEAVEDRQEKRRSLLDNL